MKHFHKKFILILILLWGCIDDTDKVRLIDYERLSEIDVKISEEIGTSDKFISGQLRDLILMSDGTMLVSDWDKTTIEQFDATGKYIGTVAGKGRGPGELTSFFLLFKGTNDTLIVRHRGMTKQIDIYKRGDEGFYSHERSTLIKQKNERFITLIGAISDTEYLAYAKWNILYMQQEMKVPNYSFVPISIVDVFENINQDSLHILKIPNPITDFTDRAINVIGMPPYQYQDRLRFLGDRFYMIARPDSSALFIYNYTHELKEYIPLHVKSRSIEQTDLNYNLRNMQSKDRNRIQARVGNIKPIFLNIWGTHDYFLLHTDNINEGKEMVVLSRDGEPEGKFYLSEFDEIRYFRDRRIYTLHKDPYRGHSIRIYQIYL